MSQKHITHSFEETRALGEELSKQLRGGEVICLYGNLGAGKTTFTQGLAKGLGIARNIISPTFIIMRTYDIQASHNDVTAKQLYHVDLYRIETEHDIEGLGILDLIGDPEAVVLIEWPEKIAHLLPENRREVHFTYLKDDDREISFS